MGTIDPNQMIVEARNFLSTNWTFIVCVALGVGLYNLVKKSLYMVFTLVGIGLFLSFATKAGLLPSWQQMLTDLTTIIQS